MVKRERRDVEAERQPVPKLGQGDCPTDKHQQLEPQSHCAGHANRSLCRTAGVCDTAKVPHSPAAITGSAMANGQPPKRYPAIPSATWAAISRQSRITSCQPGILGISVMGGLRL